MKKRQAKKLVKRRYSGHLDYNDPQLQKAITIDVRYKRREPEEGPFYEEYILVELREFFEKYKTRRWEQLPHDKQLRRSDSELGIGIRNFVSDAQFGPIKCMYAKRLGVDGAKEEGGEV